MRSVKEIAWLAGLLEGEGCFLWSHTTPCIALSMTDQDTVEKAAALMGAKVYSPREKPNRKTVYACRLAGVKAISWMMTLLTLMGERRRAKITELVMYWRSLPGFPRGSPGARRGATCHPRRLRVGGGLCKQCYMKEWRATHHQIAGATNGTTPIYGV